MNGASLELGSQPPGYRSGFVSIVGRPNVGKSTLLNQVLRAKIAITSPRPQTTRNAIRGVLTTESEQIVFVDTPGLHKPQTRLGERLNEVVRRTLREVECVAFVVDGSLEIGRGDEFIATELASLQTPVVAVVNKTDLIEPARRQEQVGRIASMGEWRSTLAVSARSGDGLPGLVKELGSQLPEGPLFYPPDMVSDQPERIVAAELIREKLLELTHEEVPHSVAVVIEEMAARDDDAGIVDIDAIVYVERPSQKGIVIGKRGALLKEVGTRARRDIEGLLGSRVYLRMRVKVERNWQRREGMISRFGYGRP